MIHTRSRALLLARSLAVENPMNHTVNYLAYTDGGGQLLTFRVPTTLYIDFTNQYNTLLICW